MSVNITGRIKVYEKESNFNRCHNRRTVRACSGYIYNTYTQQCRNRWRIFYSAALYYGGILRLEIIGTVESNKKTAVRLTRRTKYGDAVLNHEVFPEYAEETLIHEVNCFEPMKTAVEKLCEYEEMGGN